MIVYQKGLTLISAWNLHHLDGGSPYYPNFENK